MIFSLISVILLAGLAAVIFLVLTIMKKKKAWIGLVASIGAGFLAFVGLIMVALITIPTNTATTASGTAEEVDNEVEDGETTEEEPAEDITEKTAEVNEVYEVNGLTIEISNIEITDRNVVISLKAKNDSDNIKTFYPSQGDIIIGNKQLNSNFLMNKGDTWGDIHSGVEKSSTFKYVADDDGLNPSEISEIKLMYGSVVDDESHERVEFEETITIN